MNYTDLYHLYQIHILILAHTQFQILTRCKMFFVDEGTNKKKSVIFEWKHTIYSLYLRA